jgi:hypothetical protein
MMAKLDTSDIAVELDTEEVKLIRYVLENNFTMTSVARLVNTLKSCKYVVQNNIPGDFVECGVWRGGHGILAKKTFERMGSSKKVWMYDTFEGMAEPTEYDVNAKTKELAKAKYQVAKKNTHVDWCYASLEDVKKCCQVSGIDMNSIKFVKGDVCNTLNDPANRPDKIAVLRLDTDWYKSTKTELELLYPTLSNSGVLIIDDYGHWQGSRKAVDEYFANSEYKPLFNVVDYTGRSAMKINNMIGE